ncbi:HAD family hydrolase, partial [Patescibacteria group bacterium]|nr:HAD family hydrolase [Patescibacteria group bacterium]
MINILLLDRDGVINIDKSYLSNPNDLEFVPGAVEGLQRFRDSGYRFFIFTNQSGIGHEIFTRDDFDRCMTRLFNMLDKEGIKIESYRVCPHHREQGCDCRKPKTGMWESLCEEYSDLDPEKCIMIGDKDADIIFGKNI